MAMAMDRMRFTAQQDVLADGKAFMVKGRGGKNSQQVGQDQARHLVSRRQAEGVLVVVAINLEVTQ